MATRAERIGSKWLELVDRARAAHDSAQGRRSERGWRAVAREIVMTRKRTETMNRGTGVDRVAASRDCKPVVPHDGRWIRLHVLPGEMPLAIRRKVHELDRSQGANDEECDDGRSQ